MCVCVCVCVCVCLGSKLKMKNAGVKDKAGDILSYFTQSVMDRSDIIYYLTFQEHL